MKTKAPVWIYTAEKEAELLYLALAARHHCGQQQPVSLCDAEADGECSEEDDYDPPKVASSPAGAITADDTIRLRLKERFLDNFAELLARRKDARYVSSCALIDCGKKFKILVARNAGFGSDSAEGSGATTGNSIGDAAFFEEFKRQVADLHKGKASQSRKAHFSIVDGIQTTIRRRKRTCMSFWSNITNLEFDITARSLVKCPE